ncbi:MAG: SGNH/GDSL hydrolase family protein [Verrucomicrobiales bacterium]|jgi:lysophospholipase L1-like esterase|nr:SGNH/GDSL hydrolase family protein [Verrucomicrobiales bacterium]
MALPVLQNDTWLFHGDSITDYMRRVDPEGWGYGYVRLIAQWLRGRGMTPGYEFPKILNRATSGNTIRVLARDWEADVIASKPRVLSIKIGVNDVWSGLVPGREGTHVPLDEFTATYDRLLTETRVKLPYCKIVLCDPIGIWPPSPSAGNERLAPYCAAIARLAEQHQVFAHVKPQAAFLQAKREHPEIDFTADGVHPTPPGDMVLAIAWLRATGLLDKRCEM